MHFPRVGDQWTYKLPGKSRKTKIIAAIEFEHTSPNERRLPFVHWRRLPKGRYTRTRVKWLLKYGRRVNTAAERAADQDSKFARVDADCASSSVPNT